MIIKKTKSVCPECLKVIEALIVKENNKVFLEKTCPEHGFFKELYWGDAELFERFSKYQLSIAQEKKSPALNECPFNCGLCQAHESQTLLGLIDVTNRCNLNCWYCFANANKTGIVLEPSKKEINKTGIVLEPSKKEIGKMLDSLAEQKPVRCYAVEFSGGEPTIRKDFIELVEMAKEKGFTQILIATNGIELAKNPDLAKKLRTAGATLVYLKFNGLTPQTNPENFEFIPKILENCRQASLRLALVPTIVNCHNNKEVWKIVEFALDNIDIVSAVNFQPISFTGKTTAKERQEQRYTIPDLIIDLEKQSNGFLSREMFYPIPSVASISFLAEKLLDQKQVVLSAHAHCGAGTYLFKEKDKIIPITDFVKVSELLKRIEKIESRKEGKLKLVDKTRALNDLRKALNECVDKEKTPSDINLRKTIIQTLLGQSTKLNEFHLKTLFIGSMHFQDLYNFDVDRVKKCVIHYATLDGRTIPFCAYNNLGYRQELEKKYGKRLG